MLKFETGKTYWTRSPGDADCIIRVTIAKRTAKTITTAEGKRFRVTPDYRGECEIFAPWGRYSMCPIMGADREATTTNATAEVL